MAQASRFSALCLEPLRLTVMKEPTVHSRFSYLASLGHQLSPELFLNWECLIFSSKQMKVFKTIPCLYNEKTYQAM